MKFFEPKAKYTINEWQLIGLIVGVEIFVMGAIELTRFFAPSFMATGLSYSWIIYSALIVAGMTILYFACRKIKKEA